MNYVDNFRKMPTPMIVLHVASKAIIAFGLGVLLGERIKDGSGGLISISPMLIILLGIILSVPPLIKIFKGN